MLSNLLLSRLKQLLVIDKEHLLVITDKAFQVLELRQGEAKRRPVWEGR